MRYSHWLPVALLTLFPHWQAGAEPKKADPQTKRIEALEQQLRQQSQLLDQIHKELEELRKQRNPEPSPPPPVAPSEGGPLIDDSVPAPLQPPPAPETPPGGPMLDDSVPPPTTAPTTNQSPTTALPGSSGAASPAFLNPAISAVGLFEARTSSDKTNRFNNQFSAREVEIALQAAVDPYARYDIFLTAGNGESVSIEEAYGTIFRLPLDFQAKVGKFKAAFGRNNPLHTHAYPQIDRPEVIKQFFGPEGLAGPGISLSNILPTPWYSEVFLEAFSSDDNPNLFSSDVAQKPVYNVSWRNQFDLREDLTLELGVSGAYGKTDIDALKDTRVAGAHLSVKYKPLRQLGQFAITWESEYLTETQRIPLTFQDPFSGDILTSTTDTTNRSANGWYSYVDVQANRNWFLGVRYDWTHLPLDPTKVEYGWTPYVGYRFDEFNSLRLQYQNHRLNWDPDARQEVFLQWNVVIGPHGAHKY